MTPLISTLAGVLFAFAAGIFTVLSLIERPTWALMRDPSTTGVADAVVRSIHGQLRRLIRLLPPTMKVTMSSGAILLLVQSGLRGFDPASLAVFAVFLLGMGYILPRLERRIRIVENCPSDGDIGVVRSGVGGLAVLHHVGLTTSGLLAIAQVALATVR